MSLLNNSYEAKLKAAGVYEPLSTLLATETVEKTLALGKGVKSANTISQVIPTIVGITQVDNKLVVSNGTTLRDSQGNVVSTALKNFIPENYTTLKAALALTAQGFSNSRVLIVGDSTTAGSDPYTGIVNAIAFSYPSAAKNVLNRSKLQAGTQSHSGSTLTENFLLNSQDPRIVDYPAGWGVFNTNDSLGRNLAANGSNLNPITFTPSVPTDTFTAYYLDVTGYDAFTLKSGATVIATAVISGAAGVVKKVTGTTTLGMNTYAIQKVVAGSNCIILGYEATNSQIAEVSLFNVGVPSAAITDWFGKTPTQNWSTLNAIASAAFKPDLVVINFGINHWAYGAAGVAAFEASLNIAVAFLRNANIPVVIMTPNPSPISVATQATQQLYIDAMYRTSVTYGVAVLDIFNAWGTTVNAVANGWMIGTDVHPIRLGYNNIGNHLASMILQMC
jgi:lysophospholipase L1-like esterase